MNTITTAEMKSINRNRVYQQIYEERRISKHEITRKLNMSLPTVTQNLNELLEEDMIRRSGLFQSTGGRRAAMFECNPTFRVAIGVEVLIDQVNIAVADIYGEVLTEQLINLPFSHSAQYYKHVGDRVNTLIASLPYGADAVLGATIAIQGLVSSDGEDVTFSEVLGAQGITRMDFARYISCPCYILHDTHAAAFAELWALKYPGNAIFFSLNRYLGSSLIINGSIYTGRELCSCTLEHMLLYPGGAVCYCGREGCVDSYCSANALIQRAGEPLDAFFVKLRRGDSAALQVWRAYLEDLAIAVNNARMMIDGDVIIGGLLLPFLTDGDIREIKALIRAHSAFAFSEFEIIKGRYERKAAVVGSALYLIDKFLKAFH